MDIYPPVSVRHWLRVVLRVSVNTLAFRTTLQEGRVPGSRENMQEETQMLRFRSWPVCAEMEGQKDYGQALRASMVFMPLPLIRGSLSLIWECKKNHPLPRSYRKRTVNCCKSPFSFAKQHRCSSQETVELWCVTSDTVRKNLPNPPGH